MYQVTFDYSTLKAHISKITNDRNKSISDSESRYLEGTIIIMVFFASVLHNLEGTTVLRKYSSCTINIHAQKDVQKQFYLPPYYQKRSQENSMSGYTK